MHATVASNPNQNNKHQRNIRIRIAKHTRCSRHRRCFRSYFALQRQSGCNTLDGTWFSMGNVDRQYHRVIFDGHVNRRIRTYLAPTRNLATIFCNRLSRWIYHIFYIFVGYRHAVRAWRNVICGFLWSGFRCSVD